MNWTQLQVLEMAALVTIATSSHVLIVRARRAFVEELEEVGGKSIGSLAKVSDVIASLLYAAFALAAFPLDGYGTVGAQQIGSALDTIAWFTILVVIFHLWNLAILCRVARRLEPWPPRPDVAAPAS